MSEDILLKTIGLQRVYKQGGEALTILHDVDIEIRTGELVALVGPSGSGKSTFLQLAGLLDTPTKGTIEINYQDATRMNDAERTRLRRDYMGFVYQFHYLLPEFSALENVILPQMVAGLSKKDASERAQILLEKMKLSHRHDHRPARLSGGEQQRVAIARALANNPKLLMADEPTGNLDPETSAYVFDMFTTLAREEGVGALIATHNMDLAGKMDRILELKNGRILSY